MSWTDLLNEKIPLRKKVWFYLTCLRPVTKYEMTKLQAQLIIILDGIRTGDLHHYQIEKLLEQELLKIKMGNVSTESNNEKKEDKMFG